MSTLQTLINTYKADDALRASDFALMPINPKAPIISSHPIRNIIQTTHQISSQTPPEYIPLKPILNTFTIIEGTELHWTMFVLDPSNINDPTSDANITYIWKKNNVPVYELNRQNNHKGTRSATYPSNRVTAELSGEYICEVTNEYGTTLTVPFVLDIINLDEQKILYTNLVTNGDGEGGLDGWADLNAGFTTKIVNTTTGNISNPSIADYIVTTGSFQVPYPFTFNSFGSGELFYPTFHKFVKSNPNAFIDIASEVPTNSFGSPQGVEDWEWWLQTSMVPPLIANEGLSGEYGPQGFYPAPGWIDKYNKNDTKAQQSRSDFKTLMEEIDQTQNGPLTYFTRNRLIFGDVDEVTLSQTINVDSALPMIDNTIAGVDSLYGHFFAYVGIGISRYSISYTKKNKTQTVNWYIKDYETYRSYLKGSGAQGLAKIKADKGTPIIIRPHTDDMISISVQPLDALGQPLGPAFDVPTPTTQDIWAAKEKVWFPLQLYPIISFFEPNENPIQVFDTTYTTTEALKPLMGGVSDNVALQANIQPLQAQIIQLQYKVDEQSKTINQIKSWRQDVKNYEDKFNEFTAKHGEGWLEDGTTELTNSEENDFENRTENKNIAEFELSQIFSDTKAGTMGAFVSTKVQASTTTRDDAYDRLVEEKAEWNNEINNLNAEISFRKNNPEVFGGKSAMHPDLIETKTPFEQGLDRNAAFLLRRYGKSLVNNGKIFPYDIWEQGGFTEGSDNEPPQPWYQNIIQTGNKHRALFDQGASAFFGVEASVPLSIGTRAVQINIKATHNGAVLLNDTNPTSKGWNKEEIYNTLFNVGSGDKILLNQESLSKYPVHEYNNPRCAITKIKFQLIPNVPSTTNVTDKHITYNLPPYDKTVIGIAKEVMLSPAMNTSTPGFFRYNLIQPQLSTEAPKTATTAVAEFNANQIFKNLINGPAGPIIERGPANQKDRTGNTIPEAVATGSGNYTN